MNGVHRPRVWEYPTSMQQSLSPEVINSQYANTVSQNVVILVAKRLSMWLKMSESVRLITYTQRLKSCERWTVE